MNRAFSLLTFLLISISTSFAQQATFPDLQKKNRAFLNQFFFGNLMVSVNNKCLDKRIILIELPKETKGHLKGMGEFLLKIDAQGQPEEIKIISIEIKDNTDRFFDWIVFMDDQAEMTAENVGASIHELDKYKLYPQTRGIVEGMLKGIDQCIETTVNRNLKIKKYVLVYLTF